MAAPLEGASIPAVLVLDIDTGVVLATLLTAMSAYTAEEADALQHCFDRLNEDPEGVKGRLESVLLSTSLSSTEGDQLTVAGARIACGLVVPNWSLAPSWAGIPHQIKDDLRYDLSNALRADPSGVIVRLATVLNAWPKLLPLIFRAVSKSEVTLAEQKLVLHILAGVPLLEDLGGTLNGIRVVLKDLLSHPTSAELRLCALCAAANLMKCLRTKADKCKMADLLPLMAKPLADCLHNEVRNSAQAALQSLVYLADAAPGLLWPDVVDLEAVVKEIALARCLPDGTRHLAVLFLTNACQAAGFIIKAELAMGRRPKMADFISRVATFLMDMLAEIGDDFPLAMAQSEDLMYRVAERCFRRLSSAIGGDLLMPVFLLWIQSRLVGAECDWKRHYAALISIKELAEACANDMVKQLGGILLVITSGFDQPQSSVQSAAISAASSIYKYVGVTNHTSVLIPLAKSLIGSFRDPNVKKQAAETILVIIGNSDPETLASISDEILNCLHLYSRAEEIPLVAVTSSSSSAANTCQLLLQEALGTLGHTVEAAGIELPVRGLGAGQTQGNQKKDRLPVSEDRAEEIPLVAVTSSSSSAANACLGAGQTQGNQKKDRLPVSEDALISFMKAFSNGGVTSSVTLTILVSTRKWGDDWPELWKAVLYSWLYMGILFSLVTAGIAHAAEHHRRWLEAASTMVLFEVFYTIVLGGGMVGLAHTSGTITAPVCALAMVGISYLWSSVFTHPKWIKKAKEWAHHPIVRSRQPQDQRLNLVVIDRS